MPAPPPDGPTATADTGDVTVTDRVSLRASVKNGDVLATDRVSNRASVEDMQIPGT